MQPDESRVLILAPVGQDAGAMAAALTGEGIRAGVCASAGECIEAMESGAGALLLTEEALELAGATRLMDRLQKQPAWSELPVIILTSGGESRLVGLLEVAAAAAGGVTLLERPMSAATLLRSVQVALRSRRRQYQVRDLLAEQERQERGIRESANRLRLLSEVVSALLTSPDPQAVVEELCHKVREFLHCDVFFNYVLNPQVRRLRFNACGGVDARLARKVEGLELHQSLCGTAAQTACRVHAEQLATADDPRSALVRSLGIRAYACHPLLAPNNEVIGTLSFGTRNRDRFSAEDLELMRAVTDHVAVAMLRRRSELALRESEERFRSLADGTPVLIWVHGEDGGLRFVNRGWVEFFGVTLEQAAGGNWMPLVHPDDLPSYSEQFLKCHTERREFRAQVRVRRRDGEWRWLESMGAPRFTASGEFLGLAGSSVDITERKEAEGVLARDKEELERLVAERTARLQELVAELEHFSYSITHDMRAPLRAMMAFSDELQEMCAGSEQEEQKRFLARISRAARRMDLLITDALNYSRAVRNELPLAPVELGSLLRGMLDTYPEFQVSKAEISLEGEMPLVMGNEAGLTQCFSNLLGNAVKFAQPGKRPKVRVRSEIRGGWVRLWVEDEGIGISQEMLPRVFDMFSRGSSAQAGTGIGLALVRKVIDRMGGRIGVDSEQGHGSRFWIELRQGYPKQGIDGSAGVAVGDGGRAVQAIDGPTAVA